MSRVGIKIVVLLLLINVSKGEKDEKSKNFTLNILHSNDMHARFDQQNVDNRDCNEQEIKEKKCFGGFARMANVIRAHRNAKENVIFLNAGDTFIGSPWFTLFKQNITSELMNVLNPDATSLGNHEFDLGVSGLIPYLKSVKFPVVAANLDLSKTPDLKNLVNSSTILKIDGRKIGIIGYISPETKKNVGNMTVAFEDEIKAINREATRLVAKEKVNIIIALGHSGIEKDKEIALKCPLVDVVIGGKSEILLRNQTGNETIEPYGPYPIVVTQRGGKKVPVVQAYGFTKYLGYLRLKFDEKGNLLSWSGEPIFLDNFITQEPDVLKVLKKYRPKVEKYANTVIGSTEVFLQGDQNCRKKECNLGNLITDAYVHLRSLEHVKNKNGSWTDAAIGLIQAGGIRGTLGQRKDGTITRGDLDSVLPFQHKLLVVQVTGAVLKKALDYSVRENGKFLQVSGIHVVYNLDDCPGKMVESIQVLCANCTVPQYEDVSDTKNYNIIISDFLKNGGDGFSMFTDAKEIGRLKQNDIETVEIYLKSRSHDHTAIESRIQLKGMASLLKVSPFLTTIALAFLLTNY